MRLNIVATRPLNLVHPMNVSTPVRSNVMDVVNVFAALANVKSVPILTTKHTAASIANATISRANAPVMVNYAPAMAFAIVTEHVCVTPATKVNRVIVPNRRSRVWEPMVACALAKVIVCVANVNVITRTIASTLECYAINA